MSTWKGRGMQYFRVIHCEGNEKMVNGKMFVCIFWLIFKWLLYYQGNNSSEKKSDENKMCNIS